MTQVTYHGGPLISQIEIVSIYLNVSIDSISIGDWHNPDLQKLASSLDHFFDYILDSEYMDTLTDYSDGTSFNIGHGKRIQSYFLTAGPYNKNDLNTTEIGTSPDSSVLNQFTTHNWAHIVPWLSKNILDGTLPFPNPNRCYFVFLPPGVVLAQGIGLHDSFQIQKQDDSTSDVYFAVIVHPDTQNTLDQLDQLTLTTTHELVEVVTNPSHARSGWHADEESSREIADICEKNWYNYLFGGYLVSSFWSWKHNQCVHCKVDIRLENGLCLSGIRESQIAHFSVDVPCVPKGTGATCMVVPKVKTVFGQK